LDLRRAAGQAGNVRNAATLPLYWRVCLINGLVFILGTVALVLSPATVSSQVLLSEIVVLLIGLTVILSLNAVLLRTSLAPLDRLRKVMEHLDLQQPAQHTPETGPPAVRRLLRSFNAMVTRLEIERSTSNARALAAQEAERHRIAQELHDEVGQGLTVVLLGLKRVLQLAPPELTEELRLVQEAARTSLDHVRQVARRLRPGVLEDLGLLPALAALATDLSTHGDVHVERGFAPGLPALSPESELVVYRVAQEALTNVARHARATTVELSLTRQGHAVALRVADDGIGSQDRHDGAGVRGMQERALLVGGRLTISPRIGGGTEVRLLVPIEAVA
jgi:two-component system sensor histidine kinase UhpB